MEANPKTTPAFKLPSGKGIDLKKILRAKADPNMMQSTSIEEEQSNNEGIDSLMNVVSQFSKVSKDAKITKKNTYSTNKYVTGQLEDDAFERIRIDSAHGGISTSEETLTACKQISAVLKLRYKYLFQHHQDCNSYQFYRFSS